MAGHFLLGYHVQQCKTVLCFEENIFKFRCSNYRLYLNTHLIWSLLLLVYFLMQFILELHSLCIEYAISVVYVIGV